MIYRVSVSRQVPHTRDHEVMSVLGAMYDKWKEKEIKNVKNGVGRSGLDGLTTTNVRRLFNQLLYVLNLKGFLKKNKNV